MCKYEQDGIQESLIGLLPWQTRECFNMRTDSLLEPAPSGCLRNLFSVKTWNTMLKQHRLRSSRGRRLTFLLLVWTDIDTETFRKRTPIFFFQFGLLLLLPLTSCSHCGRDTDVFFSDGKEGQNRGTAYFYVSGCSFHPFHFYSVYQWRRASVRKPTTLF